MQACTSWKRAVLILWSEEKLARSSIKNNKSRLDRDLVLSPQEAGLDKLLCLKLQSLACTLFAHLSYC